MCIRICESRWTGWLVLAAFLFFFSVAEAQPGFDCASRTGENATIVIPEGGRPGGGGDGLRPGDVIGVFTPGGICAGSARWTGESIALTVWGDDLMTEEVDGFRPGEIFQFRVWRNRSGRGVRDVPLHVSSSLGRAAYDANEVFFAHIGEVLLDIRAFLQGPYDTSTGLMHTALNASRLIPLDQPYRAAPWHYEGGEQVNRGRLVSNRTIVDWVLIELRSETDPDSSVAQRAAFIRNDGRVVDTDGKSDVAFAGIPPGSYYVVLHHRNHLSVMSAEPVDLDGEVGRWDFTTAEGRAFGYHAMHRLGNGKFGLFAGDADADGRIGVADLSMWLLNNGGPQGYHATDFTLSSTPQASDYLLLLGNMGVASQIP